MTKAQKLRFKISNLPKHNLFMVKGVFHFLDLWQGESMRIYFEIGETQKSKKI